MIKVDESKINYEELKTYYNYFQQVYNIYSKDYIYLVHKLVEHDFLTDKSFFFKRKGVIGSRIKSLDERILKQKNKGHIKHMMIVKKIYEFEFHLITKFQLHDKLLNKIQPKEIKKNIIKI